MDLSVTARLSGHSTESANRTLAEVFAETHAGSAAG